MTTPKNPVDWESVEADFRLGMLSLREMAALHGVSHVSIKKRADRDGWTRNLAAKIKAKADDLVNRQAVNSAANSEKIVNERTLIEANAMVIAQVRSQHRGDIGRSRALCITLLAELESQTGNLPGLMELGDILRRPNENGMDKLNDIYQAVISLPERTKTMKALAETLKHLVGLEREAYGLVATTPEVPQPGDAVLIPDDPIEASKAYQRLMSRVA